MPSIKRNFSGNGVSYINPYADEDGVQRTSVRKFIPIRPPSFDSRKSEKELILGKYGSIEKVRMRYKELQDELRKTEYWSLKYPVYYRMGGDNFDYAGELGKFLNKNPDIKKKAEEMKKLSRIFGSDLLTPMKAPDHKQNKNIHRSINYNDGNWHPHPEIAGVQIRRSGNRQEARGDNVHMIQS